MFAAVAPSFASGGRGPLAVAWLALGLLFAARCSSLSLLADDAFISFRCARHLASSGELVYNLGERVEAYSNPLWTVVLAGFSALGLSPPAVAPILGFCCGAVGLALVYRTAVRGLGCAPLAALAGSLLVAANTSFAFWTVAGLETASFALILLAFLNALLFGEVQKPCVAVLAGMLAALAALSRTEAAVVALAAPVLLAVRGARGRALLAGSAAAVCLPALHLAWRWAYYGALLPNPAHAKLTIGLAAALRGARYLALAAWDDGVLFALPLLALAVKAPRARGLFAALLAYLGFVVMIGGDGLYRYRFVAHLLPVAGVLCAAGADQLLRRVWGRAVTAGLVLAALFAPLAHSSFFQGRSLNEVREWEARWERVGKALGATMPHGALLATNVAGRVPYYSGLRSLDLLGLADPVIADTPVEGLGAGYAGHERAAPAHVIAQAPDIIYLSVLDGLPELLFTDPTMLRRALSRGSLHRYGALFDDPRFVAGYRPAFLALAGGRHAALLIRKGGAADNAGIERLIVREWAAIDLPVEP